MDIFLLNQLVVLSKFKNRFKKLYHWNQRFILLMQYLKQKLNKKLYIVQPLTKIKNFEFIIFVLASELI